MKKLLLICLLILACEDKSNMAPLYKLLTDADVADITAYLKENKYKYKLLESIDKILVQKDSVCKIRMNLAKVGLPRIRGEIFFYIGDTEEEQLRAEYFKHREALRTELACAIETLSEVEQVIKITMNLPKRTLFLESEKPSATVIIKLRPNKTLQESQLKSIKHLILAAGSAEGLKAERVSIFDDKENELTKYQLEENTRSKIDIMSVVNQNANELKTTYNKYLKNKPGFAGKVILKFTITPSGDVTTINIISSTTDYPEFDNTIKDQVSKWKWQPITDGGNTTPTIPFNFEE